MAIAATPNWRVEAPSPTLHALLLPLNGFHLILPQPTVAEIALRPGDIGSVPGTPDWLVGVFSWRAERVPLVSFEGMCGEPAAGARKSRHIAILHALDDGDLVYYAVELKAIPHPVLLTPASLAASADEGAGHDVIAVQTSIGGHRAVIPALDKIEQLLREQLGAVPTGGPEP
jgi:chemotaxis signal transduction protein